MIVELVGLPGGGKTTLAGMLVEKTLLTSSWTPLLGDRLTWYSKFCVRYPMRALQILFLLIRYSESWSQLYTLFMNGYLDRLAKYERATRNGGIVDEGPLQNILSFPNRTLSEGEMRTFLSVIPLADITITVSISDEERKERQKIRGRGTRSREWEYHAKKNLSLAVSQLKASGHTILSFPEMPLDALVQNILAHA